MESGTGKLTIVNANRSSIETTLGVDLVYYHHKFQSFVLVQYKRLTGDLSPRVYRPQGKQYTKQLAAMQAFMKQIEGHEADPSFLGYRLSGEPFFFKLCDSRQGGDWTVQMTPGMYFPLDLWERFLKTDLAKGPQGGFQIGYHNASRRLSNTEFTRLLRGGWLGTAGKVPADLINKVIEMGLTADRSIIAAIHSDAQPGEDYPRDTSGRFVAETDPARV